MTTTLTPPCVSVAVGRGMELRVKHQTALGYLSEAQRSLVREALTADLDYVRNDGFRKSSTERTLFEQGLDIRLAPTSWYHPMIEDAPMARAAPGRSLLSAEQEKHLFLRYNFARMRAQQETQRFRTHPGKLIACGIALWYGRVRDTRAMITEANLALVLAMAKRMRLSDVEFGELVSEGNMALLRAVEKFDIARGFKFSTYACRAILKAFSRLIQKSSRYRRAFSTEFDPAMEKSNYQETRRADLEHEAVEELQQIIGENRAQLSDVEKAVIQSRFALNQGAMAQALTLEQVGRLIGLTKERVRQIQNKAMAKLRTTIQSAVLVK